MTITEQIIKCAMLKGMTQRNFPMFNLLNAAREDQMISSGNAMVMTDAYGQRVLMPKADATQPTAEVNGQQVPIQEPAAPATGVTMAQVDAKLDSLKAEINKTQGRALHNVQTEIMKAIHAINPVKEDAVAVTDET